jgi:hypothetical protein
MGPTASLDIAAKTKIPAPAWNQSCVTKYRGDVIIGISISVLRMEEMRRGKKNCLKYSQNCGVQYFEHFTSRWSKTEVMQLFVKIINVVC